MTDTKRTPREPRCCPECGRYEHVPKYCQNCGTEWMHAAPDDKPAPDADGLVQRLREMAEYKYQSHTVHAPIVMSAAADLIERQARELAAERESRQSWGIKIQREIDALSQLARALDPTHRPE